MYFVAVRGISFVDMFPCLEVFLDLVLIHSFYRIPPHGLMWFFTVFLFLW